VQECLQLIRRLAKAEVVRLASDSLSGQWSQGPSLTGRELYLFPDTTYIYTEWGCLEPETIHDQGAWRVDEGVLFFAPDANVARDPDLTFDRRYAGVRARGQLRLFGLDFSVEVLRKQSRDDPAAWASFLGLSQRIAWTQAEGQRAKALLLKRLLRPSDEVSDGAAEQPVAADDVGARPGGARRPRS
jgi:hypothetical protein